MTCTDGLKLLVNDELLPSEVLRVLRDAVVGGRMVVSTACVMVAFETGKGGADLTGFIVFSVFVLRALEALLPLVVESD